MNKYFYMAAALILCVFLPAQNALGTVIGFESLPTTNSQHMSMHGVGGPVLADDFSLNRRGTVVGIEWWGVGPFSGVSESWEATFHTDAGGLPFATPGFGGISQHSFSATGTDIDGDGIFHYVAAWTPADIFLLANSTYWFSIANASGPNWNWANAALPTIGSEAWDAVVSTGTGPNGGPHFGPWGALLDTGFAFRIILAPEPGILVLIGVGLIGVVFANRRRTY